MKRYTHVIWDFNGTILDDLQVCVRSANRLLAAHGLPVIDSLDTYRQKFGFPIIDYYRRLGFDFASTPYAELAVEWVAYYLEEAPAARLYPDVHDALERVRRLGISQWILSATELGMLEGQVEALGIRSYFERLLGLGNIHAHSKTELGQLWRAEHPTASVLLIGDTNHDAAVASAIGADCILLCRGHQSKETLASCPALCVAETLDEIFEKGFFM